MFLITNFKNKSFLLIIFVLFCLTPSNLKAHNPSHSSLILTEGEHNQWTLLISTSLTAFQHEIRKKHGVDSYKTPDEFKTLAVNHLLENISIICDTNKENIKLEKVGIKIGHSTKAVFKIIGIPKIFNSIRVKNTCFKNLSSNQSALVILKKGIAKKQFTLNKENEHTIRLILKDSKFEIASKKEANRNYTLWFLIPGFAILLLVLFRFRHKLKASNT